MSKKTSLSLLSKQNSPLKLHDFTINHSLSKKKQYLSVITPSQMERKPIKTLKQIKKIALGGRNISDKTQKKQIVISKKILTKEQQPSFITQKSWRKQFTIDTKPLEFSQNNLIQNSARTMETKCVPQTPINRLLLQSTISLYDN